MVSTEEIKQVASRLAEAVNAERVILFGSHARGEAGDESDVDLLIIAESSLPPFKRSRALYSMLRPYPFPMDLLVYTPAEVEERKKSSVSFVSTILREGKVVYVRRASACQAMGSQGDE